jgi:hypothetical protein
MNLKSVSKRKFLLIAVVAILLVAVSGIAHATTSGGTARVMLQGETHTGICCSDWSESVEVVETAVATPIVVTFSTDYRANNSILVGLRLNNGPCIFYGPAFLQAAQPANDMYASSTFQWVIMPGDYKLAKGSNSIRVCGGGMFESDSISLGFYTLSVRLDK